MPSHPNKKPVSDFHLQFSVIYESLYDAAKRFPSQRNVDEVFSKLILVGRTLGITPERRPNSLRAQDMKIVMTVAERICQSNLQAKLNKVGFGGILSTDQKHALSCHQVLEEILIASGAKGTTELAAAYLHVHRKVSFPLVSGQARIGAKLYLESIGKDSSTISRSSRPGGYPSWIDACRVIANSYRSNSRLDVCLLELNDFLEQQVEAELCNG
jgi:hypothetical protein